MSNQDSGTEQIVAELAKARIDNDAHKVRSGLSEEDLGYHDYTLEEAWEAVEEFRDAVESGGESA